MSSVARKNPCKFQCFPHQGRVNLREKNIRLQPSEKKTGCCRHSCCCLIFSKAFETFRLLRFSLVTYSPICDTLWPLLVGSKVCPTNFGNATNYVPRNSAEKTTILIAKMFQHQHSNINTPRPTISLFNWSFVQKEGCCSFPASSSEVPRNFAPTDPYTECPSCGRKRWWHSTVTRAVPQRMVGPKMLR